MIGCRDVVGVASSTGGVPVTSDSDPRGARNADSDGRPITASD